MANVTKRLLRTSKILLKRSLNDGAYAMQVRGNYQGLVSSQLMYSEFGDPVKVIQQKQSEIDDKLKPTDILVKMLAAPVNPADINTIEGKYPSHPELPAVAGNEGVAEVMEVGAAVRGLSVGDRIVPLKSNLGTWRTHAIFPGNVAFKVPKNLGIVEAATLTVNPCTAYRMLRDFVRLTPGDTIIQNGANSACGQYAIQIARTWGLNSVNIVRDREDIDSLKNYLLDLGATHVLTEEELKKSQLFKSENVAKPRLALNCVGGKSALEIARQLQPGGTMVTYGGMSREPVTIPTSALIFKDIRFCGFWMSRWTNENFASEDRLEMFDELISMMTSDELRAPTVKMVKFSKYQEALANALNTKGMVGRKYILDIADVSS